MPVMPIGPIAGPMDFSGTTEFGIYTAEATQRHAYGRRVLSWDGRVYRYAQAKGTLNPDLGAKGAATQNLAYALIVVAQVAGDKQVSCTFGAADGYANSGLVVENELAGGYCVIFSNSVDTMFRGIIGNSAVASGGGTGIIYVDEPFHVAIATADSFAEAIGSPYYDTKNDSDGTHSVVGVPVTAPTSGQNYWLQTWGPTWIAPQSGVGNSDLVRAGYWRHDGSLDIRGNIGTNVTDQYAGYCLQNSQAGTQGAPFFMLQVNP